MSTHILISFVPPFGTTMIGLTHGVGPSTFSIMSAFNSLPTLPLQVVLGCKECALLAVPRVLHSHLHRTLPCSLSAFQCLQNTQDILLNILPCINSSHKTDSKNTQLFCGISSK